MTGDFRFWIRAEVCAGGRYAGFWGDCVAKVPKRGAAKFPLPYPALMLVPPICEEVGRQMSRDMLLNVLADLLGDLGPRPSHPLTPGASKFRDKFFSVSHFTGR
jgi:hypothetical protein